MAKNLTTPNRVSPRQQLELRAAWAADFMTRHPSLCMKPGAVQFQIRKQFGCGGTQSKLAYKRAGEMMIERLKTFKDSSLSWMVQTAIEDYEAARARGDLRTADAIRMNLAKLSGVTIDKLELSGNVGREADPDLSDFSEDELLKLLSVKSKAAKTG